MAMEVAGRAKSPRRREAGSGRRPKAVHVGGGVSLRCEALRGRRWSGSVRAGCGLELVVRRETRELDERAEERDVVLGLGEGVGLVEVGDAVFEADLAGVDGVEDESETL